MDDYAMWNGDLVGGLLLVFSNLALLPAILWLARRGDFASAAVYLGTFTASMMYHSCRAFELCLYRYEWHKQTDYLFVYRAIVWTLTSLGLRAGGSINYQLHIFLFFVLSDVVYFLVVALGDSGLLPLFGIGLPLCTVIWYNRSVGNRMFYNRPWTLAGFATVVLSGIFMFALPTRFYAAAHTLWHIFSMLSVYMFLRASDPTSIDGMQHEHEKKKRKGKK